MSEVLGPVPQGVTSPRTGRRWIPVIGLEVHCQLDTATKLFCGCENRFGAEPNTLTCPVCTGQPGALPVLNRHAVELAVRAALALGAEVHHESVFARKNYFYPDLPKGYQISQFERPYCTGGGLELAGGRRVRLVRIHIEEDAGKAIHDRGDATLVDLNRAGVPLIESVTEPDLRSSAEAHEYLVALREILRYVGVSDCDMEKGSLRCDVNVSVQLPGEGLRSRVEVKNLNSFRNVQAAIEREIVRQIEAYEGGDPERYPEQETRLYDPQRDETRVMRRKEDSQDYRYFPEPDLPPLALDAATLEAQRGLLPELPAARRGRYVGELGLSQYDAGVLTSERAVSDFFEATLRAGAAPKAAANWIANEVLRALGEDDVQASTFGELAFRPVELASLVALVDEGTLSNNAARKVLAHMLREGGEPRELVDALGLAQVSDSQAVEAWCREALAQRPQVAEAVRGGNEKAVGAAMGAVMGMSGGRADPGLVRQTLLRLIREG